MTTYQSLSLTLALSVTALLATEKTGLLPEDFVYTPYTAYPQAHRSIKETNAEINTYHGQPITPDNIKDLAPQLDAESKKAVETWIYNNMHIVSTLVNAPVYGLPQERIKRHKELSAFMEACGLKNLSDYNFVLAIEVPIQGSTRKYPIKIAGPANRRENYNALLGRPYGSPINIEDWQKLREEGLVTTYQSISRIAHGLRLQEWTELNPDEHVFTPKAYLVHIPGTLITIADTNYVVVEEVVENIGTPAEHPLVFLSRLPAVMRAAVYAGLWNISSRQFLITPEHAVACIDLEQPNNSSPSDFFHKNHEKYEHNVKVGIEELEKMEQMLIARD